jgi:hypothetical protein
MDLMSGSGFYGTPNGVRHLLSAHGPHREQLMRELIGDGSVADHRNRTMYETPSGLIVPGTALRQVDPLDKMRVYLTSEDIFGPGKRLSFNGIIARVKQVSLENALAWCARWVAKLHDPRTSHRKVDAEFVELCFEGEQRRKVEHLLRDPHTVLLATQTFIVLSKLALEHCERRGLPPAQEELRPLAAAVLAVPSHLTEGVDDVADEDLVVDVDAGPMGSYIVANQMFNDPPHWQTAWAVFQRCLRELPVELKDHPRVVDFDVAYLDATGVTLEDLITICALVWTHAISNSPSFPVAVFDSLKWEPSRLDAVLDLISATPETLREMLQQDNSALGLLWSTKTFDQFPIVRWEEHLTVLHPAWVVNRSTGQWPLLDVRRDLGDRPRISKVAASVQHTHEHYALEVIEDLVGHTRLYRDDALRRAFGRQRKVADAAIDYGNTWVVVEVTTEGFQLKTAAGISEDALAQDIDDIVRKATQVERPSTTSDATRLHSPGMRRRRDGGSSTRLSWSPRGSPATPLLSRCFGRDSSATGCSKLKTVLRSRSSTSKTFSRWKVHARSTDTGSSTCSPRSPPSNGRWSP